MHLVKMVEVNNATHAVDTPEDLKKVELLMSNDILMKDYPKY